MNIFAIRLKEALTAKNIKPSELAKKLASVNLRSAIG